MTLKRQAIAVGLVFASCLFAGCSARARDADGRRIHPGDRLLCYGGNYPIVRTYSQGLNTNLDRDALPSGTIVTVSENGLDSDRTSRGFVDCTVKRGDSTAQVVLHTSDLYRIGKDGVIDALIRDRFGRRISVGNRIYAGSIDIHIPVNTLFSEPYRGDKRHVITDVPKDVEFEVEEVCNGFVKVTYQGRVGWLLSSRTARTSFYWFYWTKFAILMIVAALFFTLFGLYAVRHVFNLRGPLPLGPMTEQDKQDWKDYTSRKFETRDIWQHWD